MKVSEALNALRNGKTITNDSGMSYMKVENGLFVTRASKTDEIIIASPAIVISCDFIMKNKFNYELYQKHESIFNRSILSESEKNYLSDVIRPFKGRYEITIKKSEEYINIHLLNVNDYIILPCFIFNDEMYKGMQLGKDYTPEELGL